MQKKRAGTNSRNIAAAAAAPSSSAGKKEKWKADSEAFRAAIRAGKQVSQAIASGGPLPGEVTSNSTFFVLFYIECIAAIELLIFCLFPRVILKSGSFFPLSYSRAIQPQSMFPPQRIRASSPVHIAAGLLTKRQRTGTFPSAKISKPSRNHFGKVSAICHLPRGRLRLKVAMVDSSSFCTGVLYGGVMLKLR